MNFTSTADKFDVTAYNAQAATVGNAVANLNSVTEYNSTTLGTQTVQAGANIIFIENGASDTFYVFKIDSTDTTFDANDSVSLLGTVTTAGGTIVTGDLIA